MTHLQYWVDLENNRDLIYIMPRRPYIDRYPSNIHEKNGEARNWP